MKNLEKANKSKEIQKDHELESASEQGRERLREDIERRAERGKEKAGEESKESLSDRAHELAKENVENQENATAERSTPERHKKISPAEKKQAFDKTMKEARAQMSGPEKAFSKVIHNPAVEAVSQATAKTVARPNSILFGSVFALCFVVITYIIAKHQGYPLAGSETIIAFAAGWVFGLLFDYIRVLITGKAT